MDIIKIRKLFLINPSHNWMRIYSFLLFYELMFNHSINFMTTPRTAATAIIYGSWIFLI
jgi:hypothetical protein